MVSISPNHPLYGGGKNCCLATAANAAAAEGKTLPEYLNIKTDTFERQNKTYIPKNAGKEDIQNFLADKNNVDGRPFKFILGLGHHKTVAKIVEKAKDKDLAVDNLNFLLNAKDKKLDSIIITELLASTVRKNETLDENKLDKLLQERQMQQAMDMQAYMQQEMHRQAMDMAHRASLPMSMGGILPG
jgi:hypothetical protein